MHTRNLPNFVFYPLLLAIIIVLAVAAYTGIHPSKMPTALTTNSLQWSASCSVPSHLYVQGKAQMRCMVYGVSSIKDVKMGSSPYVSMTKKTRTYVVPLAGDYRDRVNTAACPASLCFTATVTGTKVTPRPPFSWEPIAAPVYLTLHSHPGAGKLWVGELQVFADYFGE